MTAMRIQRSPSTSYVARPQSGSWHSFDIQLAFYALALGIIGLLMAWTNSTDGPLASGSTFTRGLMWFAIAIVSFTLAAAFDYRWLRTFSWLIYLVNIGLLLVTMAIGIEINGAQRWVSVAGLTFQFSEISKVLMIAVLAAFLAGRKDKINRLSTYVGAGLLTAPPFLLIMIQPDLGTALVLVAIMLFLQLRSRKISANLGPGDEANSFSRQQIHPALNLLFIQLSTVLWQCGHSYALGIYPGYSL